MNDDITTLLQQGASHLTQARRMTNVLPLLPVLIFIALSLTGCGQKTSHAPPIARPVRTMVVSLPSELPLQVMTGEIRAHDETSLGFRLDGRIVRRNVDIGDHVRAGDVLATIESDTTANQVTTAQADVSSAAASEQVALINLNRMKQLMPSGAIARAQLDTAQSDWKVAFSRLQSSKAALKTAEDNFRWTQLTAPVPGIVTSVSASAGQVISAGQTVLTLASGTERDVVLDVTDPAIVSEHSGEAFNVSLLNNPAAKTTGHLRDISPQADPQTRTWRVRIVLDMPSPLMVLGASVTVSLPGQVSSAFVLPASALTRLYDKPAVFVCDEKNKKVWRREVTLAEYSASSVFVTAGLRPGERVVTAGVSSLRDGQSVSTEGTEP